MRLAVHVIGVVSLCALSFGTGLFLELPQTVEAEPEVVRIVKTGPPSWRLALNEVRATAQAGTLRAEALDVLNEADGTRELAHAIELVGWTGGSDEVVLLEALASCGDDQLEHQAIVALGRVGTDLAVDVLLRIADSPDRRRRAAAVSSLGQTTHHRAWPRVLQGLDVEDEVYSAASAAALFGTTAAAHELGARLLKGDTRHATAFANALGRFDAEVPEARKSLMAALQMGAPPRRIAAMHALAQADDPEVFPLLRSALESGSTQSRAQAATALGTLGDPRAIPLLRDLAEGGADDVRYASVRALAALESPLATSALLDLVEHGQGRASVDAIGVLRNLSDPDVLGTLLRVAEHGTTEVRDAAAGRLYGEHWPQGRVPTEVLEMAREDAFYGRRQWDTQVFAMLLRYGDGGDREVVLDVLRNGTSQVRSRAVWALQQHHDPAYDAVILELVDDPDRNVRSAAINAAIGRGPAVEAELERILVASLDGAYTDWGIVEQTLVRLGTETAVDAVVSRIEGGTEREWGNAIGALANSGSPEHLDKLTDLLARTDDERLKRTLYNTLLNSRRGDVASVVEQALAEGEPELDAMAARALGRIGGKGARKRLDGLLDSDDQHVRSAALDAVADLGGPDSESLLIDALHDDQLASTALGRLQNMGTRPSRQAVEDVARDADNVDLRTQALYSLGHNPGEGSERLLTDALSDDSERVRRTAVSALEMMGTTYAAEALATQLDGPEDVARQAAMALQRMGGRVAETHSGAIEDLVQPQEPVYNDMVF